MIIDTGKTAFLNYPVSPIDLFGPAVDDFMEHFSHDKLCTNSCPSSPALLLQVAISLCRLSSPPGLVEHQLLVEPRAILAQQLTGNDSFSGTETLSARPKMAPSTGLGGLQWAHCNRYSVRAVRMPGRLNQGVDMLSWNGVTPREWSCSLHLRREVSLPNISFKGKSSTCA